MVDAFAAAVTAGTPGTPGTAGADARVLDAGCGTGRMSAYLAARGCLVEGVDLSPGMVAMARRDHPGLPFEVGSLSELPSADAVFAGVLLCYSIIHTPPPGLAAVVAEVARVLRPGGYVLVATQAGEGVRDVAPSYRSLGFEVVLERHLYTADAVAAHLTTVGLEEVHRLERPAQDRERDDQAVVLARSVGGQVRG
jgi:SAM-dependent methyltransferase